MHGQHETVGLLDWKTHRALLDAYGGLQPQLAGVAAAADRLKAAERAVADLRAAAADAAARKLNASVELLPVLRVRFREQLRLIEDGAEVSSMAATS